MCSIKVRCRTTASMQQTSEESTGGYLCWPPPALLCVCRGRGYSPGHLPHLHHMQKSAISLFQDTSPPPPQTSVTCSAHQFTRRMSSHNSPFRTSLIWIPSLTHVLQTSNSLTINTLNCCSVSVLGSDNNNMNHFSNRA